jgi:cytochrome c oxidase assembly protein subunit 15
MTTKINIFSIWLLSLTLSICAIILIGGYTRISDSGLSITEWLPISGIKYPMNETHWQLEFSKYQKIDEFMLVNSMMTLNEFKVIYFWEWFHRFFARFIGLLYFFPLIYLLINKQIQKKYFVRIFLIGIFLGAQAIIGWYMVKSGLVGRIDVSQYRLAMHLTMAFIILGITFQTFLETTVPYMKNGNFYIKSNNEFLFLLLLLFIFFQISYGAFVSGTHSGLLFNTWPMYDGSIFPLVENNHLKGIINFFERGEYIIFMHRSFAVFLTFLVIYLNYIFFKESNSIKDNFLFLIFNITFIVQILLGVLMTFQNIPWHLALAHQGNAIILFLIAISMWMFSKKSLQNNLL